MALSRRPSTDRRGVSSPLGALLVPFTDLSVAMKATLSGALIAGVPEVFTVAAVALLGKSGFDYVKSRIMALLRRYSPPPGMDKNTGLRFPEKFGYSGLFPAPLTKRSPDH